MAITLVTIGCSVSGTSIYQPSLRPVPTLEPKKIKRNIALVKPPSIIRSNHSGSSNSGTRYIFEGWVLLNYSIDTLGNPYNIEIIDESPANIFSTAAINTVQTIQHVPETIKGSTIELYKENAERIPFLYKFGFHENSKIPIYSCQIFASINKKYLADPEGDESSLIDFLWSNPITNKNTANTFFNGVIYPSFLNVNYLSPSFIQNPKFPKYALKAGVNGHATVTVDLKKDGQVKQVRLLEESPGCIGFGTSALAAAKKFKYRPIEQVEIMKNIPFKFNFILGRGRWSQDWRKSFK